MKSDDPKSLFICLIWLHGFYFCVSDTLPYYCSSFICKKTLQQKNVHMFFSLSSCREYMRLQWHRLTHLHCCLSWFSCLFVLFVIHICLTKMFFSSEDFSFHIFFLVFFYFHIKYLPNTFDPLESSISFIFAVLFRFSVTTMLRMHSSFFSFVYFLSPPTFDIDTYPNAIHATTIKSNDIRRTVYVHRVTSLVARNRYRAAVSNGWWGCSVDNMIWRFHCFGKRFWYMYQNRDDDL